MEIRLSFRLRFGEVKRSKHDACVQKLHDQNERPSNDLAFYHVNIEFGLHEPPNSLGNGNTTLISLAFWEGDTLKTRCLRTKVTRQKERPR